jgi:hypothetical protein
MPRNSLVRVVVAALLPVVIAPAVALGAKPLQQFHDHFTDSFASNICGIAVNVNLTVTDNLFVNADGSFKDTSSVRQTFTNPLNGKSVIISVAGQTSGAAAVVNEEANTISFDTTYRGRRRSFRRVTVRCCCVMLGSSPSGTRSTSQRASSSGSRPSSRKGRILKPTAISPSSARR